VDDHPLLREGVRSILAATPGIAVVGQASDGHQALELFRALRPDITLMDIQMPNSSGIEAITRIRNEFPEASIIVLSTFKSDVQALGALRAGAKGYLLKTSLSGELVKTIEAVHSGRRHVTGAIAAELAEHLGMAELTEREVSVLKCVSEGNSNREVAAKLSISLETVKQHMKHIATKLGTNDRAHAVAVAIRRGIIDS